MIDESQFSEMLPKELDIDTVFVHECFSSMFSGMLNWIGNVLYPRFKYKVITTYDKAVEVFKKKMSNIDGQVQTNFLPALTLDPVLDFSNDERAGRFLWMFRNLHPRDMEKMWNRIQLTDQGLSIQPMFTRYQGTVEVTGWFESMYELIDFRVKLLQYCNGYQHWIRPDVFWTHLILPKQLLEYNGPEGKIDWNGINPELITLSTTDTEEYALPFGLDAMWRLDSFNDSSNKMGADQIAEYKCTATFTWECNIPTFIRIYNYAYPIENINLNVGMTPVEAKYPIKMNLSTYNKLNLYNELPVFCKYLPIWNIKNDGSTPLIKMQDDMCDVYPKIYQHWNHYVCGKIYDIKKLNSPDDIKDNESILVIDKYKEDYEPYVRKCRGLISKNDRLTSWKVMELVKNYNISFMCDIKDINLYQAILSLHGRDVTYDIIGKVIYNGIHDIIKYDGRSDFTFTHNIARIIKEFNLQNKIKEQYKLSIGQFNIFKKLDACDRRYICEQFEGLENKKTYQLSRIVNTDCVHELSVKINGLPVNDYEIHENILTFGDNVTINDQDVISLYRSSECEESNISLICDYKISKDDEVKYYYQKKKLEIPFDGWRNVNINTIQCVSYKGLLNKTIDFIVDETKKVIVFNIEPHRDSYIQIFGSAS